MYRMKTLSNQNKELKMKIVKPESVGLSAERLGSFDKMLMDKYIGLDKSNPNS